MHGLDPADEGRHDDAPGMEGWGFDFGAPPTGITGTTAATSATSVTSATSATSVASATGSAGSAGARADAARGTIRLTFDAVHARAAFVVDLATGHLEQPDRVVVADEDLGLPRAAAGLELRGEGLWASLYCETPFEHWTLGLEAFGLRVEPHASAPSWDALVGERVAVGFDLEWERVGDAVALVDGDGYRQDGIIHGTLLVERSRIPVDAPAVRDHWWGA